MPKYQARLPYITTEWYEAEFEAPDEGTAFQWVILRDFWPDRDDPNCFPDSYRYDPHPSIKWKFDKKEAEWGNDNDDGWVREIKDNDTKGEK